MWVNLQLCFDVMAYENYRPWTRLNNRFFLDFIFYALNVKKIVFLQQMNGFSCDYNVKLFFGQIEDFCVHVTCT